MKIMSSEWKGRIQHWIRTLREDLYFPLGEISWEAFETTEHLSMKDVQQKKFHIVKPGFTWGNTWEYCWFRGNITLPREAEGERIVLNLNPGGESCLFVNGEAFGTYRAPWVDEPHHYMEDNVLTRKAKVGETYKILMETYAGHFFPDAVTGECGVGPVLPGSYQNPLEEGKRRVLGTSTYGIWNEQAYQLYLDVVTLSKLLQTLDETSLRAAKIEKALEKFTLIVDFEQGREERKESYIQAREMLRSVMEAENGSTTPVFYAVGNAHLDLAWLWPMQETYRKTERTFAAQLRLIEEYPEYKFIQSQPASYEMCKKYYPELFAKVKNAIKKGQWIADGAMWVEPDTNMAGGEALIRQLLIGKQYYKEEFDVESKILWLPDTFGYTAALPQILKGCEVDYLVTQKIFWSYNEGEQFPYHYFNWKGMDGTEVVSFLPTSYTYRTDPIEANRIWKERTQVQDLDSFLMPYGYGDGGGGPARDHIEYALRQKNLEGSVKIKMAGPMEFFKDMEEKGAPKHTYTGELYFSAHRGTYTSQAMIKKQNRRSEIALREMELWSSLAYKDGLVYEQEKAKDLWKDLLLHQFHDILPGSSIARVYEEAEQAHKKIQEAAAEMRDDACRLLLEKKDGSNITVWNSLGFARNAIVTLPDNFAKGAETLEGENVPIQEENGKIKAFIKLPACGAVSLKTTSNKTDIMGVKVTKEQENFILENNKVLVRVNFNGEIVSFVLKESGREFVAKPMNHFLLYKDVPRLFDAWDIDSNYIEQEIKAAEDVVVEVIAEGLEGILKVTGRISNSVFVQYIRLATESERVEFETEVDWRELHRLLKVSFPTVVYAENGLNEMQFGYVERPAHRSRVYDKDRFEVCNHRYSALCDGAHGVAVLNDCKYGISMNENALELTLLRASASPEMRADNCVHHFCYAFTAWEGTFTDCNVVEQGYDLNIKPWICTGMTNTFSAVTIEKSNIMLETMKLAEDGSGDLILRFYESKKAAVITDIYLDLNIQEAYICNMLENIQEELPIDNGKIKLAFRAFEIKTVRIKRN